MKDIVIIAAAVGLYFLVKQKGSGTNYGGTTSNLSYKRQELINYLNSGGDSQETKTRITNLFANVMNDAEIDAVYAYLITYKTQVAAGTPLWYQISIISSKYNIFT